MGMYFNPKNKKFRGHLKNPYYVDKSGLIKLLNDYIDNDDVCCLCVSRPRRFGKSYTADMLTAYYSRGCDSRTLFEGLDMAKDPSFEEHLNKYNVVYFDVAQLIKTDVDAKTGIENLTSDLVEQIEEQYPHIVFKKKAPISMFEKIYDETDVGFVFIIDEWDCPFRERKDDVDSQDLYLLFLKDMFKNDKHHVYVLCFNLPYGIISWIEIKGLEDIWSRDTRECLSNCPARRSPGKKGEVSMKP